MDSVTGNLVGSAGGDGVIDPLLGDLADNGGPTLTHALLLGSPAIDAGGIDNLIDGPANDQRGTGFNRAVDFDGDAAPQVDIGAFELGLPNTAPTFAIGNDIVIGQDADPQTVLDFATDFNVGMGDVGASAASQVLHDEGEDGLADPLSTDNLNPTDLGSLADGSNIVRGVVEVSRSTGNVDVFSFTIEPGMEWTGLFVDEYEYVDGPPSGNEQNAFLAINIGTEFPYNTFQLDINNPLFDRRDFLGGTVFGVADLPSAGGFDVLPRASIVTGRGFTAPLPAGTYTIFVQQTGPANTYALDVRVQPVASQRLLSYTVANVSDPSLFSVQPTVNAAGTLRYTPAAGASGVATFEVTARDSGGIVNGGIDISAPLIGTITIREALSLTWDDPDDIPFGTELSETQLNAVSNLDGTFIYTPPLGTVLPVGESQTLSVTFTPDDTFYDPETTSVSVTVLPTLDYGDAPETFPVTAADDGASHVVGDLRLGNTVDIDADGTASAAADSDGDTDDGITTIATIVTDPANVTTSSVLINASSDAVLNGWIDFDANGTWSDDEQIATDVAVSAGDNVLSFSVPTSSVAGQAAARFRLSTQSGLTVTGPAPDGEVEDMLLTILAAGDSTVASINLISDAAEVIADESSITVRAGQTDLLSVATTGLESTLVSGTSLADTVSLDVSGASNSSSIANLRLDGSGGENTIVLEGTQGTIDLSNNPSLLSNFSIVNLGDSGENTIVLVAASVRSLAPSTATVTILGGAGHTIVIQDADDWRMGEVSIAGDQFVRAVVNSVTGETLQTQLPTPWQNIVKPGDINNNGEVTAGDALVIINELAANRFSVSEGGLLDDPLTVAEWPSIYYDQNGDGNVTALDALRVINELTRISSDNTPEAELVARPLNSGPSNATFLQDESPQRAMTEQVGVSNKIADFVQRFQTPASGRQQVSVSQAYEQAVDLILKDDLHSVSDGKLMSSL